MGTTITFRRGSNDPTSGSGLTLAEPAFNTTLNTFHIGLGHGVTAAWVGAPISGASADIAAGITYKTPTLKAVKDYVTDYVTAVNGVLTVNGFAGGVTLNAGTALGLTSSSGNITLTNLGVQSFNGLTGAVQGVSSWNGQTGAVSFVNYVASFNGLTGAVGGVTTSVANTFVPMQSFSAGISAAGGTFTQRTVFTSGIQSGGITASTVTSEGTSTISGYAGYASRTTVSADTIKFVFDGGGGQILRPTDDNIDGSNRTNYLPAASGTLALTSQLMGAVNGSTAATTAVTSFNGRTGAVQGVSSWNGQTGAVSFVNYVASVNGATGAVTNVAKTNEITSFSAASNLLTVSDVTSGDSITINPSTNKIVFYDDNSGNDAQLFVGSFGNQVIALPDATCTLAGRDISQTFTSENTFTALQTFSAGISAAGCTFSSTTNTLDVIASTEGAGLRIARAASGVGSRIGGIRFGRSTTSSQNTYLEGSSGTFNLYNGVDNTGTLFAAFSTSQFSLGTTSASFISLNCPNTISFGDQSAVGNNQIFAISGTNRTYTFGDPNGTTTGFVGINRSGLCGDYALEVNSPTGKGLQLIYNDHTGAASNWVNMDVSSGGNFTVRPSGGLATVTGTLNVSAGLCAAGGTFSGDIAVNGGDITTTSTTATLYNTTATTVNIGAAATTVSIAGNTAGMTFGMGSYHKFKTNRKTTTSTSQTEIFRFNYVNPLEALIGGNDAAYAEIIITAEQTDGSPGYCSGTQITKILVAATPGDGVVNHVEYGNVNTNGNLATYTASGSLNDVLIYATPVSSATTVFKVFATLIRGEFGVGI